MKITPWNYKWDGKCEYCGHDYATNMELLIDDKGQKKKTSVTVDSLGCKLPLHCDIYTVLSGVTIRTTVGEVVQGEVFLTANELKHLIETLKNSPIIEQYDYLSDPEYY